MERSHRPRQKEQVKALLCHTQEERHEAATQNERRRSRIRPSSCQSVSDIAGMLRAVPSAPIVASWPQAPGSLFLAALLPLESIIDLCFVLPYTAFIGHHQDFLFGSVTNMWPTSRAAAWMEHWCSQQRDSTVLSKRLRDMDEREGGCGGRPPSPLA